MEELDYLKCENYSNGKISRRLFVKLFGHIEILKANGNNITNEGVFKYIDKLKSLSPLNKRTYYRCLFGETDYIYNKIQEIITPDFREFLKTINFTLSRCHDILESFIIVGIEDKNDIKSRLLHLSKLPKNGVTKEKMLLRYGDIVGEYKWKSYCDKQKKCGCSLDYFIEKYGEIEGEKKYIEVSKSKAITLEKSILRHGESEGTRIFNDYCRKQAYSGNKLNYFIEKYGEIEGEKEYNRVCEQKKLNKQTFIRKYGEVEGNVRFEQWKVKINNRPKITYSKNSQILFWKIFDQLIPEIRNDCYFEEHSGEFMISTDKNIFFVDFAIPSLKYAIEFYGNYYHANPLMYEKDYYFKNLEMTSCEIWEKDKKRINKIKDSNIFDEIIIIWESDFKNIDIKNIAENINEKYRNQLSK